MGSERGPGSQLVPIWEFEREKTRAERAEADARSWEAKWLKERMDAKKTEAERDEVLKALRYANDRLTPMESALAAKDAELASLRQRVEEQRQMLATVLEWEEKAHGLEGDEASSHHPASGAWIDWTAIREAIKP